MALRWIMLAENLDRPPGNEDRVALDLHLVFERAVNRVVFQQMREGRSIGEIVDRDQFEVRVVKRGAKKHTAGTTKAINRNLGRHCWSPSCIGVTKVSAHRSCQ